MKVGKGELRLIKDYIVRNIDPSSRHIKTFYALVLSTIPKKDTLFRAEHEFASVVRAKIRPTGANKNSKRLVIRFGVNESLYASFIVNDSTRKHVYDVYSNEKSFIPEFKRHGGAS